MCNKLSLNLKHWMSEILDPQEVDEFARNLDSLRAIVKSADICHRNASEFQEFIWQDEFCSLEVMDAIELRAGNSDFPWGMINTVKDKAKLYASIEFCIQLIRVLKKVDVKDSATVATIVTDELTPDVVFGMYFLVSKYYWYYWLLNRYFGIEVEGNINVAELKKEGHTDFILVLKYCGKSITMRTDSRNLPL